MIQKIVAFAVDELRFDAAATAETLLHACRRRGTPLYVRGMCQVKEAIYFTLLPCNETTPPAMQYVWVENPDKSREGITSLLEERWAAGFDLIGSVDAGDDLFFLLFAKNPEDGQ
jgi:hypothetical protein